ncbi:MAG: hypothetical protein Q8O67_29580 [Deltaproteobacteria bacterium]|nr:hypothetical protein [Deltaproteobacteria bacterium]
MPWGLRLSGNASDQAGLMAVLARAPKASSADWLALDSVEQSYVVTDALGRDDALALTSLGHDVVQVAPDVDGKLEILSLKSGKAVPLAGLKSRKAKGLLLALRPVPTVTKAAGEGVFVVDDPGETARLIERLLILERDDARVCTLQVDAHAVHTLVVRVPSPPVWLLLWCGDEARRGVRAYVRNDDDSPSLYTAVGFRHPLSSHLADALHKAGEIGLLDADGTLRRTKAGWPEQNIHDALQPELPAQTTTLTPLPLQRRFTVRLRLAAALSDDAFEPELFLLDDDDDLFLLESFLEGAAADEVSRLLLSRVGDASGRARYVLREAVRAGVPRLGSRIASMFRRPGFARVPGFDGLYLPPGRRLVPQLRRDDLRALLSLEDAGAVVVDEDADGLKITRVSRLDDEPVGKLLTWMATSRRVELDRMLEEAVLTFPGLTLSRPKIQGPAEKKRVEVVDDVTEPTRKRRVHVRPASSLPSAPAESLDVQALRERETALEDMVFDDVDNAHGWRELASVKTALGEKDDATAAIGAALFLVPEPASVALLLQANDRGADIIELCTVERPNNAQAQRLCALVLQALAGRVVDDGVLQQAEQVLLAPEVPLSRRLQWAVLRAIHARSGDVIGLTRAKEAVMGALNGRGLTEALDLPRFIRARLALGDGGPTPIAKGLEYRARTEQLVVIERLLPRVVDNPLDVSDGRGALLKAIFLVGFARLGSHAADLSTAIDAELPAHDGPVRILLRLYQSRAAFALTSDGSSSASAAWAEEVKRAVAAADKVEDRRVAEWLIKRSLWLRADVAADPVLTLRPSLEKLLARAPEGGIVDAIRGVASHTGSYDYEIAGGLERLLDMALQGGRDDVIEAAAVAAHAAAPSMRILAHRARLLGAVVRAAATVGATGIVERALDDVSAIASDKNVPSTRDLLVAVRPALFALRRLGALEAARRFLSAFEPLTTQMGRETGPLSAALAEGFHQLADNDDAENLLERALERVLAAGTAHVDRYEAGAAVVAALQHWPHEARAARCEDLFGRLPIFTDTFTTRSWFPTHQLLMAERLIECLVDEVTVRSDRLQHHLDQDEARVRRRILTDWRAVVG